MKTLLTFIRTTLVGGLFVIVPLALAAMILDEVVDLLDALVEPVVELLPVQALGGVDVARVVAWISLLAACFLAGLAARTGAGKRISAWFEGLFLDRLPGYTAIKSLLSRAAGPDPEVRLQPACVQLADGTAMLGFVVEELDDDKLAMYVPSSPTPMMGSFRIVEKSRAQMIDAPVLEVLETLMHYGVGARELVGRSSAAADQPPEADADPST